MDLLTIEQRANKALKGYFHKALVLETENGFEVTLPEAGVSYRTRVPWSESSAKDDFMRACQALQQEFSDIVDPMNKNGDFVFSWKDKRSYFRVVIEGAKA